MKKHRAEVELSGDEPDERQLSDTLSYDYDPTDTLANISTESVPERLKDRLLVVVNAYMNIGEALAENNAEAAKAEARELVNLMQRYEQENLKMEAQIIDLYTKAAHFIRQSPETITNVDGLSEIRISYYPMAPAAYKMAKVTKFEGQSIYYYYCPNDFDCDGA
ncbi:hypothetical protein OKW21_001230 [Catalinimonas alkaloidigena]|uniref:DUF3347 domain-containing protein n=1 Tax=Catalinimonas alkaloidigena TaxID=1075417 RepID=UPI002404B776|nr:DUF3347 domain-containing protein [Catalinimonas alkaloidigena]MDF9795967.1 hypothetical protein [Catalinimonas alkaloidigena]